MYDTPSRQDRPLRVQTYRCIQSFLFEGRQQVIVNPFLFLVFINNLPICANAKTRILRMIALYTKTYSAKSTAFNYMMILTDRPIGKKSGECGSLLKSSICLIKAVSTKSHNHTHPQHYEEESQNTK